MRVPLDVPAACDASRNETELIADFGACLRESQRWPKLLSRNGTKGFIQAKCHVRGAMDECHFGQIYIAGMVNVPEEFVKPQRGRNLRAIDR